ncbi:hypothetical protein [Halanaerobium sp.]|nr:hypothetical protein [Halanaerobium sp.]PUU87373.1 MAG: hypothetical protein CI949_3589 [Halanaerobium sp.]
MQTGLKKKTVKTINSDQSVLKRSQELDKSKVTGLVKAKSAVCIK